MQSNANESELQNSNISNNNNRYNITTMDSTTDSAEESWMDAKYYSWSEKKEHARKKESGGRL